MINKIQQVLNAVFIDINRFQQVHSLQHKNKNRCRDKTEFKVPRIQNQSVVL